MEKILGTPQAEANTTTIIQESKVSHELRSPTNPTSQSGSPRDVCCRPATTPDRLKVPKASFKYPERYTSPTDLMMSPISRGLLARRRKLNGLLPPSKSQPKLQSFPHQEAGLFQC